MTMAGDQLRSRPGDAVHVDGDGTLRTDPSYGRRQLLWFEVTRHPTAAWLARQITEAFPWASAPDYLVRDNDRAYGQIFTARVRVMGIRDRPITPGSPWQNGIAERLIGTLRRECLDQLVVFGEGHLRRVLSIYAGTGPHRSLQKDAPLRRSGYDFWKGQHPGRRLYSRYSTASEN
jgi:transposase InsO family protein